MKQNMYKKTEQSITYHIKNHDFILLNEIIHVTDDMSEFEVCICGWQFKFYYETINFIDTYCDRETFLDCVLQ